jgi:hypothetical protein
MAKKLDHTDRKKLIQSIRDIIGTLEAIEDRKLKEQLCHQIIGLCDQMKFTLILDMQKTDEL